MIERKNWHWVSLRLVLAVHDRNLAEHGGGEGIRDQGLLESAIARPQQKAEYGSPDVFELAGAYAFSISQNHPFIDGNKRTAFSTAYLFLVKNGYRFAGSEVSVVETMFGLAAGRITEVDCVNWLRAYSVRI